jgi:hypothetical protein
MRSAPLVVAAALAAVLACDDTGNVDGARGPCASGGALAGCPDSARTAEAACWRLVECGSYPIDAEDEGRPDWGVCLETLERFSTERARLVIACIGASTCDELIAPGSPEPYQHAACFEFGGE